MIALGLELLSGKLDLLLRATPTFTYVVVDASPEPRAFIACNLLCSPTRQMIGFLSVDGACELYITFITQIAEEDEVRKTPRKGSEAMCKRPEPGDEVSEELKRSFR